MPRKTTKKGKKKEPLLKDLKKEATRLRIPGRSKMKKSQLLNAIKKAGETPPKPRFITTVKRKTIKRGTRDVQIRGQIITVKARKTEPVKKTKKLVEYDVEQHQYKAGKAWIAKATKNWGVEKDSWQKPYDVVKEGYYTTKFYKLPDGRYVANTVGSKRFQKRIRLEIKGGEIVKEESFSV